MSAIKIQVDNRHVTVSHEEKTAENISRRFEQLKQALGINEYGLTVLMGLKPTEDSKRLLNRWQREPSAKSYQEMPEHKWKHLLTLVDGQTPAASMAASDLGQVFDEVTEERLSNKVPYLLAESSGCTAELDGEFSLEQLTALVRWMESKN